MPKLSAEEIADKMIASAGTSVETVVKGIERMTETPGAAAKRKKEKYRAGVQRALDDGSFDAGMDSYTLQDFKAIATEKVRERWVSGITKARPKIVAAREQLNSYQQQIENKIAGMPNDTEQQRDARMLYNVQQMRKFRLKKSRR